MPKYSVADLQLAASTVEMAVQDAYDRYDQIIPPDAPAVPGLTHLANIVVSPALLSALKESSDVSASEKDLLATVFAKDNLFGTIDIDDTNHIGIISFRGTRTFHEWFDDIALCAPVPFDEVDPQTNVHLGFLYIYRTVRKSLLDQLDLQKDKLKDLHRIIVTGHSLGAAVASLCLLELRGRPEGAKYEGMTYASPGVFFGKPRKFIESGAKNLRIANPADIVPRFPSVVYWHVSGGLMIDKKKPDFHSLKLTYLPGTQKLYADAIAKGDTEVEILPEGRVPLPIFEEDIVRAKAGEAEVDVTMVA